MNYKKNIRNLSASIRPYRKEMSVAVITSLLKQISIIGVAFLTSYFVGLCLDRQEIKNPMFYIYMILVLILLRAVMGWCEMYFAHDVAFRVIRDFRSDLFLKISEISPDYMIRKKTGQLGQSLISDVEVLELFLAHTFSGFLVAAVMTAIIFAVLWFISPYLSVLLLVFSVLILWIPYSLKNQAGDQGATVREALAESNSSMVEFVQGMKEIVTLDKKRRFERKIMSGMNDLYDAQKNYGKRKGRESMAIQLLSGSYTCAVMLTAAVMVAGGSLSFALYPAAVMLSTILLSPVMEVSAVSQEMGVVFAASNRIQEILNTDPVVKNIGTDKIEEEVRMVSFEDVSFGYESEEVLHEISFQIKEGENVVLVGHSGAGKTTCANLLLRYWDPSKGHVRINGKDLRDYSMESLRSTVAAVSQECYLFHMSIRENIRMGRPDATDAEVEKAARAANIHEFIISLPMGYDTIAGERGTRLSGGQKQRIAIARALLRNTPVIIFDEAVSSLDTENELYVQKALKKQMQGKTMLMIAHRLSTILSADKIVLLDHGRISDQGTHEELMQRSTIYRELIERQLF